MPHGNQWLLMLVCALLLAACSGGAAPTAESGNPTNPPPADNAPPTDAPAAPATPAPGGLDQLPVNESGVPLVARVNGAGITLPLFQQALNRRQNEEQAADLNTLAADVLDQLIEQTIIIQGAAAQSITVTDAEVQAELDANIALAGSPEAWAEWLRINGYTDQEFRDSLRITLINNRVRDSLTADLGGDVAQVHARHILVRTEAEATSALAAIQAGEDFGVVAQRLSLDETTRINSGDLGWFTRDELVAPELAALAFALQPGQVGGPVGSVLGFHVVQTLEAGSRPVEPEERRVYIAQARFDNWLRPLLESAVIERYL